MEEVKKPYLKLDGGTVEEHLQEMKEFLGLRPDQSFQDIEDDDDI